MNFIKKNPFERKQKGAMSALCIVCKMFFVVLVAFFAVSGCGKKVEPEI